LGSKEEIKGEKESCRITLNGLFSVYFSMDTWFFYNTCLSFFCRSSDTHIDISHSLHIPYNGIVSFLSPLVPLILEGRIVDSVKYDIKSYSVKMSNWNKFHRNNWKKIL